MGRETNLTNLSLEELLRLSIERAGVKKRKSEISIVPNRVKKFMEEKVDTSTKADSQIMRELGIDRSDAPRLPRFSLRITLYLSLVMLILAAAAIDIVAS